jgi:hypothetical protein
MVADRCFAGTGVACKWYRALSFDTTHGSKQDRKLARADETNAAEQTLRILEKALGRFEFAAIGITVETGDAHGFRRFGASV